MTGLENIPLVNALDASGTLRHIDEVANGERCGCFCPADGCGQPLIAKNSGTKKIHHFAHKSGACSYAVESGIQVLARDILLKEKKLLFPKLSYYDCVRESWVEIAPATTLHPVDASLESLSGRPIPDIVVTCQASNQPPRRFLIVFWLSHSLSKKAKEKLSADGMEAVEINLRALLKSMKDARGRHFDRDGALREIQSREIIREMLVEDVGCKTWAYNKKRAEFTAAKKVEKRAIEEKRAADLARKKAEQEALEAKARAEREARAAREAEERNRRIAAAAKLKIVRVNGSDRVYECPFNYEAELQFDCEGSSWHRKPPCANYLGCDQKGECVICEGIQEAERIIAENTCPACGAELEERTETITPGYPIILHGCSAHPSGFAVKKTECPHEYKPRIVEGNPSGFACVKCGWIKPA